MFYFRKNGQKVYALSVFDGLSDIEWFECICNMIAYIYIL